MFTPLYLMVHILPLPAAPLVRLASDLAHVGVDDASYPKIARHVRARARSAELREVVGRDAASSLLESYAQMDSHRTT